MSRSPALSPESWPPHPLKRDNAALDRYGPWTLPVRGWNYARAALGGNDMARGYGALESAARSCCHEILQRSGVDWPGMPAAEPPLFTSMVNHAHAWLKDVTARQARETGLDATELLSVVVEQLRDEHGWDVGIADPWLLYAAGSCRTCGLAMPLASLGSHLRRCLGDDQLLDDRRLN